MRIQPEKAIGWLGVVPVSQGSAVYAVIFFPPTFPPKPSEERSGGVKKKKKTKGWKQKRPLRFILKKNKKKSYHTRCSLRLLFA